MVVLRHSRSDKNAFPAPSLSQQVRVSAHCLLRLSSFSRLPIVLGRAPEKNTVTASHNRAKRYLEAAAQNATKAQTLDSMTDRKQAQRSRKASLSTATTTEGHSNGGSTAAGAPRHGSVYLHHNNSNHRHSDSKSSTLNTPLKQNQEASAASADSGSSAAARVLTNAADLTLDQQLAVLDEATELPPFGFNIAGLERRLQRRLGFEITQVRCSLACV